MQLSDLSVCVCVCVSVCAYVCFNMFDSCDPVDCSLPSSSVHRISQQEQWSGLLFSFPGDLSTQGLNPSFPRLLHFQAGSLPPAPSGKP